MLVSEKVMDALKGIGLNLYERKLWVALLAKGAASPGELAELANVPRSRSYDTLQSLVEKGFALLQSGRPLRFVAVEPEEALERVRKKLEEKFLSLTKKIEELKSSALLRELKNLQEKGLKTLRPEELTGMLKGRFLAQQQLETMLKAAKRKVSILATPEQAELFPQHAEILRRLKEKGVEVRLLALQAAECLDALKALNQIVEVRVAEKLVEKLPLQANFVLIDEKELLFGLTDSKNVHESQEIFLWSRSEHATSKALEPLFNLLWERAKPL